MIGPMGEYPIRIRFWYWVHDRAERFWHWVYRAKIAPWHQADRVNRPQVPPTYHLIETREPTPEQRASGIDAIEIYGGR